MNLKTLVCERKLKEKVVKAARIDKAGFLRNENLLNVFMYYHRFRCMESCLIITSDSHEMATRLHISRLVLVRI